MTWEELTLPFPPHDDGGPTATSTIATGTSATGTAGACDLSTQCGHCGGQMRPEHAHYRCTRCGQRDSCCDGPY